MPLLDLLWTMFIFFLLAAWLVLLMSVFTDLFRSLDVSGWGKAGWVLLTIALPFLGAVAYVVVRGGSMQTREAQREQQVEQAAAAYVRGAASSPSTTEELVRLGQLRESGALTEDEFAVQKARLLAP